MAACGGETFGDALAGPGIGDGRDQRFDVGAGVPDVEDGHPAELGHGVAVGADAGDGGVAGTGIAEAVAAAGEDEAGGEALDIPLPRGGEGLVEVVNVEDLATLGGGEGTEVKKVAVAASLGAQAGRGGGGQVGGHVEGGAAVESEGGLGHAAVADGDEPGNAPLVGLREQGDGVGAVGGWAPVGV